ncbi:hypothetical protein E2320_001480 [Naja naja]|nr:hypothetical protein E2320_001480 [Naja naja]
MEEKEKEKEMENYKEVGEEGTDKEKEEEMGKIDKEWEEASAPRGKLSPGCKEGDKRNFPSPPLSPAIDSWVPSLGLAAAQTERQMGRREDEESAGQQRGRDPSSSGALPGWEESFLSLIATPASHGERREILRMVIGQPVANGMHFPPPF